MVVFQEILILPLSRKLIPLIFFLILSVLSWSRTTSAFPTIYPVGTTIHDRSKAFEGYTVYNAGALSRIIMVDMDGNVVHYWEKPGLQFGYTEPLSNGNILVDGRYENSQARGVFELDWDGNIVWKYSNRRHPLLHHDFERLGNGNTMILYRMFRYVPKISSIPILDDYILEVNPQGKIVWRWDTYRHFNEFGFSDEAKGLIAEKGGDWAHTNSIQSLPDNDLGDPRFKKGNILVSQRHTNIIYIIDRDTGDIVWKIGPDDALTLGQHDAKMIPIGFADAGNILVFDNGYEGGYPPESRYYSRVVTIDPLTKKIVQEYDASKSGLPLWTFYSPVVGGAQRLRNGNTLIDEGVNGRFFEVTSDGEIVWEYINPYYKESNINSVYRVWRVGPDWP